MVQVNNTCTTVLLFSMVQHCTCSTALRTWFMYSAAVSFPTVVVRWTTPVTCLSLAEKKLEGKVGLPLQRRYW